MDKLNAALTEKEKVAVWQKRDASYDGLFFFGVKTTVSPTDNRRSRWLTSWLVQANRLTKKFLHSERLSIGVR